METRRRLSTEEQVDIIKAYTERIERISDIAERYHRTRQGIWNVLRRHGIETTNTPLQVTCNACGKEITRFRYRIRNQLHQFCGRDCYYAFLKGTRNITNSRWGQMVARQKISEVFTLQDGHVVHHVNGNQLDNRVKNLMVFANQGDHIRFHRGFEVKPVYPLPT